MWFSLIRMPSHSAMRWLLTAADAHRVLLCLAQAGQGLAGVEHDAAARVGRHAGDGLDVLPRHAGHGRQHLQEIQRRALGAEQGARIALDPANQRTRGDGLALGRQPARSWPSHPGWRHRRRTMPGRTARRASLACTWARTRRSGGTNMAVQSARPMSSISASRTLRVRAWSRVSLWSKRIISCHAAWLRSVGCISTSGTARRAAHGIACNQRGRHLLCLG